MIYYIYSSTLNPNGLLKEQFFSLKQRGYDEMTCTYPLQKKKKKKLICITQ